MDGLFKNVLEVLAGLAGILVGARLLVNSIIGLSEDFGVAEYLLALLLMSLGTLKIGEFSYTEKAYCS